MATARTDRKRIEEFIIPRGTGKAFHLAAGQILRITAHEGKQVADVKFINAHDHREQFCAWWSSCLNAERPSGLITGGTKRITELFSKPPWERVPLRVIDDKVGDHLFNRACSTRIRELMPEFEYLVPRPVSTSSAMSSALIGSVWRISEHPERSTSSCRSVSRMTRPVRGSSCRCHGRRVTTSSLRLLK